MSEANTSGPHFSSKHLSVLRIEPNVRGKEIPACPKLKRGVREEPQWAASQDVTVTLGSPRHVEQSLHRAPGA